MRLEDPEQLRPLADAIRIARVVQLTANVRRGNARAVSTHSEPRHHMLELPHVAAPSCVYEQLQRTPLHAFRAERMGVKEMRYQGRDVAPTLTQWRNSNQDRAESVPQVLAPARRDAPRRIVSLTRDNPARRRRSRLESSDAPD